MHNIFLKYALGFIIALCLISRLPQLVNISYVLDLDECIVGLMAKHFAEGREIPLFFYGQSYGFSFIEVAFARIAFLFFGVNEMSMRVSMLVLWTIGICFHYKTLKNLVTTDENNTYQHYLPLVVTLFFVLCPAWAVWSMKARGGYLTAFTLFSVVTYFASHRTYAQQRYTHLLIGFILVIIFQAQPLFLVGLLPFLSYFLYQKKSAVSAALTGAGIVGAMVLFYFLKKDMYIHWSPKIFSLSSFHTNNIIKNLYENLTGSYFYGYIVPKTPTIILSKFLLFALLAILGFGVFRLLKKQNLQSLFYVSLLAILGTIAYTCFIKDSSPRYLLPLYSSISFLFFTFLQDIEPIYLKYTKLFKITGMCVLLLSMVSIYNFRFMSYEGITKTALSNLINDIESQGNRFVFCSHGGLPWQIMFYSQERILARDCWLLGRYPSYTKTINDAIYTQSSTTAIVGYSADNKLSETETSIYITADKRFFIYKTMDKALLQKQGFAF